MQKFFPLLIALSCLGACSATEDEPAAINCSESGPTITLTTTDMACGTIDQGSLAVEISGGTGALLLSIEPEAGVLTGNTFNELPEGDYTVTVTDANSCSTQRTASIAAESQEYSYQNDIKPIIEANCTLDGCHNGDNDGAYGQNRNWLVFENVQNNSLNIKNRINRDPTAVGFMPKEGSITADEIAMITCWVDNGAMNN